MALRPRHLLLAAGLAVAAGVAAATEPAFKPGSVVRWSGAGLERCAFEDVEWAPLGPECFFPIDLKRTGRLTLKVRQAGAWKQVQGRIGDYPYPVQRLTIKDESRVDLSAADLARVERENERIGKVFWRQGERRFTLPLAPPLATSPKGGRFGSKRIINGQPKSPHTGADYAVPAGTPVYAVAAGTVRLAEEHFFGGKSVFIDHGDRLVSMVLHLSNMAVAEGESVERGQLIGKVGSTGRSTGPHLHLGLRWQGARVDPGLLLGPVAEIPALP